MRTVDICGRTVPAIGMGMAGMGTFSSPGHTDLAALLAGFDSGARVLDTAEMYGDGASEALAGSALRLSGLSRSDVYVIDKILPHHASSEDQIRRTVLRSLRMLRTDHIDLYLLHWRSSVDLALVARSFHHLREDGLIGQWGVSNFDVSDLEDLWAVPYGNECAANEDMYNIASRGIDFDLLGWQRKHRLPLIAYSPLGSAGFAGLSRMRGDTALEKVARKHHASWQQVELAWVIRDGATLAIPQSSNPAHMRGNIAAADLTLDADDLALLDERFPKPTHKIPLAKL